MAFRRSTVRSRSAPPRPILTFFLRKPARRAKLDGVMLRVRAFAIGVSFLLGSSTLLGQVSFPGPELLGRPTDHSVTINVVPDAAIDAYFEYGTQSGGPYDHRFPASGAVSTSANLPLVAVLGPLEPNTRYFYRMVYRPSGASSWSTRDEHSFYTQRTRGSTFTFTVTSDSHIGILFGDAALFHRTLQNVASDNPDFHLDLGDTFAMDDLIAQHDANTVYLSLRPFFAEISHSVPIFLVVGNHEQEEGWHLYDTHLVPSPPVMTVNARALYYLNPDPLLGGFFSGNTDVTNSGLNGDHTIGDYYAWEWGDALFVVIDPYWYSVTKPYTGDPGGESYSPGSGDFWDWTLGEGQYLWLKQTLEASKATYKFLFTHQLVAGWDGSPDAYGWGGANAATYAEWGGNNSDGVTPGFAAHRAGWYAPIHRLLVENKVTAVFHGHDHEFAYEKRNGVVYQAVPMAAEVRSTFGFGVYKETDPYTIRVLRNSGHLRVTISPLQVRVDYVRAFRPSDQGTNGSVDYSYTIAPPGNRRRSVRPE